MLRSNSRDAKVAVFTTNWASLGINLVEILGERQVKADFGVIMSNKFSNKYGIVNIFMMCSRSFGCVRSLCLIKKMWHHTK